jgi:hypothetical protein
MMSAAPIHYHHLDDGSHFWQIARRWSIAYHPQGRFRLFSEREGIAPSGWHDVRLGCTAELSFARVRPGWGHLGEPPTLTPERADLHTAPVSGRRVILDTRDGHIRDMRAVSELVPSDEWPACPGGIRIATEAAWYAWQAAGSPGDFPPGSAVWPATMVYVER